MCHQETDQIQDFGRARGESGDSLFSIFGPGRPDVDNVTPSDRGAGTLETLKLFNLLGFLLPLCPGCLGCFVLQMSLPAIRAELILESKTIEWECSHITSRVKLTISLANN